jgi:nucleotide-binding universal stress UspA family protein
MEAAMRILLAVDGSEEAREAARSLSYLAPMQSVTVLHVLDIPTWTYPTIVPEISSGLFTTLEQQRQEDGEHLIQQMQSLLPSTVQTVSTCVEKGTAAEVILATAAKEQSDLIVLGSRGLGPLKELVLGSVTHNVILHSHCPVWMVNRPMQGLRRLVIALSGVADAEAVIKFLTAKPFPEAVEITALTVVLFPLLWPVGIETADSVNEKIVEVARQFVDEVVSRLRRIGYRATSVVTVGRPEVAISGWAAETVADLILVGTRRPGKVERLLLGSVSHAVLHQAPCPIIVVP